MENGLDKLTLVVLVIQSMLIVVRSVVKSEVLDNIDQIANAWLWLKRHKLIFVPRMN
jgi:hypothetical protein